jgi:predicted DNA-binding antitoxin AbrB/MazE fold protein
MIGQTVTAVYKNGILKPQKPLNLAENEQVEIQILRTSEDEKPLLSLWGIWSGLGDLTYEDIQSVTREMHEARMKKLFALFDEPNEMNDE